MRIINRNFSLAHYDKNWTKIERYLFIEIYNAIKEFYIAESDEAILDFTNESITLRIPTNSLDKKLFKTKNKTKQILNASKSLIEKSVGISTEVGDNGQIDFIFVSMFVFIKYENGSDDLQVKLPREIYDKMIPIQSYCQLDLKLLGEFKSGNTIRLYEIFKSYAFKKSFIITIHELRKKMGFYESDKYPEWKQFNRNVLKPAVNNINKYKDIDIEVSYRKERGVDDISFKINQHQTYKSAKVSVLSLNQFIDPENRTLNMIQEKFINSLIKNCKQFLKSKGVSIKNGLYFGPGMIEKKGVLIDKKMVQQTISLLETKEVKEWIISDLINLQLKKGGEFDWYHSCNGISKQIRLCKYTQPFSHYDLTNKMPGKNSI